VRGCYILEENVFLKEERGINYFGAITLNYFRLLGYQLGPWVVVLGALGMEGKETLGFLELGSCIYFPSLDGGIKYKYSW